MVARSVIVECDCAADEPRRGLMVPRLIREHAKQMQCVGVLRLNGNDLPVKRFRLTKSPRLVVLDGGSESFGNGRHITQAENPPRIVIGACNGPAFRNDTVSGS